jgi:hypothetical protein
MGSPWVQELASIPSNQQRWEKPLCRLEGTKLNRLFQHGLPGDDPVHIAGHFHVPGAVVIYYLQVSFLPEVEDFAAVHALGFAADPQQK